MSGGEKVLVSSGEASSRVDECHFFYEDEVNSFVGMLTAMVTIEIKCSDGRAGGRELIHWIFVQPVGIIK